MKVTMIVTMAEFIEANATMCTDCVTVRTGLSGLETY